MDSIRVVYFVVILVLATSKAANGSIGVTWGRMSAQRLIPSVVVDLLLQNGIKNCRVYVSSPDILKAFAGSGINLTIGIFNLTKVTTDADADDWVQTKIIPFYEPVRIRKIYVSNYVFMYANNSQTIHDNKIRTMKLIQKSLNKVGLKDQIKVTTTHSYETLKHNISRPSEAEFKDEYVWEIKRVIAILKENDSPFVIGTFPINYISENKMDIDFGFADNRSNFAIRDINGAVYTNVFDFLYDSFLWAVEKAGGKGLKVVVDQVGWPTDGFPGANISMAERYYKGMIPKLKSNVGTPKLPGQEIEAYLHSLLDETKMSDVEPWSRHWGIYRSNGRPKYRIDFLGEGRDIYPTGARGIKRMPDRWCLFIGNVSDYPKAEKHVNFTCKYSDCTSLAPGGSCSRLTYRQMLSYKYNVYFQTMYQAESACIFDGLAKVVTDNPSTGECVFPVEVVMGEQVNYKDPWKSHAKRIITVWPLFFLSISAALYCFGLDSAIIYHLSDIFGIPFLLEIL